MAPNGVFNTVQGEGNLLGVPMTFVRLAGCSVGCPGCDTDYSVALRLSVAEVVERVQRLARRKWVWLTGGEPTDHPLALDQHNGIDVERRHELAHRLMHD